MKNYLKLCFMALLGSVLLWSCNNDRNANDIDNDTYPVAYDISGNFQYDSSDKLWKLGGNFNRNIPNSDVVMVYKKVEVNNGQNVWEPLPVVYHANEYQEIPVGKQLKYSFDFTTSDFRIIAGGDFDLNGQSTAFYNGYINNQTFRVVVVPASFGAKKENINYSNLNEVMRKLNIQESSVIKKK